jgi:hypothetical protein
MCLNAVDPCPVAGCLEVKPPQSLTDASSATETTFDDFDTISDVGSDTSELAVANSTSARDLDLRLKDFCDIDYDSDCESLAYSSDSDGHSAVSDPFDFDDLEDDYENNFEQEAHADRGHAALTQTALRCSSTCSACDGHSDTVGMRMSFGVSSVY